MAPVLIVDEMELMRSFGNKGSLIDAYRKIRDSGEEFNLFLVKTTGTHKSAFLHLLSDGGEVIHNAIEIKSIHATDDEKISISISSDDLRIITTDTELVYQFETFKTVHELIYAISSDGKKGVSPVSAIDYSMLAHKANVFSLASVNQKETILSVGNSGILASKNALFFKAKESLEILVGESIDAIALADCYIDDSILIEEDAPPMDTSEYLELYTQDMDRVYFTDTEDGDVLEDVFIEEAMKINTSNNLIDIILPDGDKRKLSFYELLIEFSREQMLNGIITKSILGFRPVNSNTPRSIAYYQEYMRMINSYADSQKHKEVMALVSVTASDIYYDKGGTIDNMYLAYLGGIGSKSYIDNMENKRFSDNILLRSRFDKEFVKKFNMFVYARDSRLTNRVHVLNGVNTSTLPTSRFEYVIRSVQHVYKVLYPTLSSRLGEPLTSDNIDSFDSLVSATLSKAISSTICEQYKYSLETLPSGDTNINCNLYFEGFLSPFKLILELKGEDANVT